MGTPEFSVPALNALSEKHEIIAVYTQPPRPAGRGKAQRPSPVHQRAQQLGLHIRHPLNFKSPQDQQDFSALNGDIAVVVAYGLILPKCVLDAPRLGCLNIHASLLPRWRGAAPIHRAIMAGDTQTGICIMRMEEGLDTGPIMMCKKTPISTSDTTLDLYGRLSQIGAEQIIKVLDSLPDLFPRSQSEIGVSYAQKISKTEARINFNRSAIEVDRLIRSLSPFPGAWVDIAGERIKLLRSSVSNQQGSPGEVLQGGFTIACREGAVVIHEAQRQGKRAMPTDELLKGLTLPAKINSGSVS